MTIRSKPIRTMFLCCLCVGGKFGPVLQMGRRVRFLHIIETSYAIDYYISLFWTKHVLSLVFLLTFEDLLLFSPPVKSETD